MSTASVIVEEIEVWRKSQAFTPAEASHLTALTAELSANDHKRITQAFVAYLRCATKYRTIWIEHTARMMKAINPANAKARLCDPRFDVVADVQRWIHERSGKNPSSFEAGVDKWKQQIPLQLAAIRAANLEFISKSLSDLPADLVAFIAKCRALNTTPPPPPSVDALVMSIKCGECTIAALGVPSHQVMAWPLKPHDFPAELIAKEALTYLKTRGLSMSPRKLSSRATEHPSIKVGSKYSRDGLAAAVDAGHFAHGNSDSNSKRPIQP